MCLVSTYKKHMFTCETCVNMYSAIGTVRLAPYRAVALYTFAMEQVQSCTINDSSFQCYMYICYCEHTNIPAMISTLCSSAASLAGYVREQLVHTVALMVKRSTLEVNQTELFDSVFATVSRLLGMDAKLVHLEFQRR